MRKHYFIYVLVVIVLCLMCGREVEAEKKITSISFKKYEKTLTIEKGEKKKLKVKITPKKASNKELKWTSNKKKIVSVTSKGEITGKKKGKATITVRTTDGSKLKLKLKVIVGVKVDSIVFSNREELNELVVGKTFQLKTLILPLDTSNKNLEWSSSDEEIAVVDSKGNVTGKSNGVVKITARTTDGTNKQISTTITVVTKVKSVKASLKSKSAYCTALNQYAVYAKTNTKFTVESEIKPETATNKTLEWTSSNPKVATVSADGKVQTLSCGVALITASATDGSEEKDTFTVYVGRLKKEDCKFIAHRGRSEKAPDNSRTAIELALQSQFDYVELDVWKTIDDQFVVTHDESLLETCGFDAKVTELTLSQVTSYRIISGNNVDVYCNEYIPSLGQILFMAQSYPDKHLYIELKHGMSQEMLQSLLDLIDTYEMRNRVTILTFNQENIITLRSMSDSGGDVLPMQYLNDTPDDAVIQFCLDYHVGLGAKYNSISEQQIGTLQQNELEVNVWGVPNFLTVCHMVNTMKVDAVTTDYMFFE